MPSGKEQIESQEPQTRVRSLALVGSAVVVDPSIPLHRYFRSGTEMLRMAKMYLDEGQLENAFILYSKYITLFVEKIPKHPAYENAAKKEKAITKEKLKEVFPVAEKLKTILLERYTKEFSKWLEEKKKIEEEERQQQKRLSEEQEKKQREEEIKKEFEKEKQWRLAQEREKLKSQDSNVGNISRLGSATPSEAYSLVDTDEWKELARLRVDSVTPSPSISSQDSVSISNIDNKRVPTPSVDRSTKPRSLLSPGPETEYIHGLRIVVVPIGLMASFLRLAQPNTNNNIETCGILAGKMAHNQLVITHLLVPKQTGTADSCSTDNEEEIFSYQDKYDLITIGWIHTHPSQTAFMSSVDLHTHCSYQLMMPEAIAIVCSPKYQETGIFSLTCDYGLDYIAGCQQPGFHPHPKEPTIYEECTHIKLEDHATVIIVDLRK